MIIIFTLIAALVLLVLGFAAKVFNGNKKVLKDENKIDKEALLVCDRLSEQDLDLFECFDPYVELRERRN